MFDVRKFALRVVLPGVAIALLAGALAPAMAQIPIPIHFHKKKKKQNVQFHQETNAIRLQRIRQDIQETYSHRYEIFGGGGYLRFRSGDYTQRNNEITWASAFNYYLNTKFALVGDAGGYFGDAKAYTDNIYGFSTPQINEYTFMGGVSYRFFEQERLAVSIQGLGGTGWGVFNGGSKTFQATSLGLWKSGFRPAFSAGVNFDYNLSPALAVRFTPTWVGFNFVGASGSSIENNLGFNAGIVYRFGHR